MRKKSEKHQIFRKLAADEVGRINAGTSADVSADIPAAICSDK